MQSFTRYELVRWGVVCWQRRFVVVHTSVCDVLWWSWEQGHPDVHEIFSNFLIKVCHEGRGRYDISNFTNNSNYPYCERKVQTRYWWLCVKNLTNAWCLNLWGYKCTSWPLLYNISPAQCRSLVVRCHIRLYLGWNVGNLFLNVTIASGDWETS